MRIAIKIMPMLFGLMLTLTASADPIKYKFEGTWDFETTYANDLYDNFPATPLLGPGSTVSGTFLYNPAWPKDIDWTLGYAYLLSGYYQGITDLQGSVDGHLFSSDHAPISVGNDFSQFYDVVFVLAGAFNPLDPSNPGTGTGLPCCGFVGSDLDGTGYRIANVRMFLYGFTSTLNSQDLPAHLILDDYNLVINYVGSDSTIRPVGRDVVVRFTNDQGQDRHAWFRITSLEEVLDSDGDGLNDDVDACPDTAAGATVNAMGCSIAQICPCAAFANHGQFVACTTRAVEDFVQSGLVADTGRGTIISEAAQSNCSKQ